MNRLILFRHGKAEADSESGEDFDRRLAPRGEREAAAMGEKLARLGFRPDLALVSTAARTRETWAAAAAAFPAAQVRLEDDLYHADSVIVRRLAERAGRDHAAVMVVGHNPGLHELAVRLMVEGDAPAEETTRAARDFPPASVAVFRIGADGSPTLEAFEVPERQG